MKNSTKIALAYAACSLALIIVCLVTLSFA